MREFVQVPTKESTPGRAPRSFSSQTSYGSSYGPRTHTYKPPVPVGTFSGKPLSNVLEPPTPKRTAGVSVPHPTLKQSTSTLANDNVETFWQGARKDVRITKDVLNRTVARRNKAVPYEQAASNGSHIKFDSFLQTKYAPGSRAKPPSPYVSQYNSKFNMHMGHYEKRGLIDEKAKHPIVRYSNRPVSAGDLASVNKYKSRVASVRLYQET